MTLALAAGSASYTVVVTDRRLTSSGSVVDEEFQKLVVFSSPRARLGVAFAGLATAPGILMNFVLPDCLLDAAKEGPQPEDVVEGVARRLDAKFASLPASLPDATRRTAVLFAGYKYEENGGPKLFVHAASNLRPGGTETDSFHIETLSGRRNYIAAVGSRHALAESDRNELAKLIDAGKPPAAVVGKAVDVFRAAARSTAAQGAIGGQLLSVVLPADGSQATGSAYHTESLSDTVFLPSSVTVDAKGEGIAIAQPAVIAGALSAEEVRDRYRRARSGRPRDTTQRFRPIAIPKVGRNQPCPCGSGQKYKRCHGR